MIQFEAHTWFKLFQKHKTEILDLNEHESKEL